MKQNVNRHKEYEESIQRLSGSLASMQGKLKDFTSDYEAANEKAVNEKEIAEKLCPRVTVTKYQKCNMKLYSRRIAKNGFIKVTQRFTLRAQAYKGASRHSRKRIWQ